MTTETPTIDPADLASLVEKVRRLEESQGRRESEKAASEAHSRASLFPEKEPKGFAAIQARAQNELRELRVRAAEEADREYQVQLAGSAAKRARLEKKLEELAAQRREEEARHRAALEPLDRKCDELRKEHDALFKVSVTLEDVLVRNEFVAERERINREWAAEQVPIGTGATVEEFLEARRKMAQVRV